MPEDSPSIYTIMAERVANAVLGKINALIGSHNTNEQAHQDIRATIPSKTSDLTNDSGFLTQHQSLSNYVTTDDSRLTDARTPTAHNHNDLYYTETETDNLLNGKSNTNHTHSQYLTQHQSLSGYLQTSDVKDNLTSTDTNKPLSAKQGKELKTLVDNKIDKGHIQGGVNLLGQWLSYTNAGAGAVVTQQNNVLFHGDEVVRINNSSVSDTTKYTDMYWEIPYTEFGYNDVFTFSFYAKGTNNAQIKTYFYGESGYITVKRLSSNSTVSGNDTEYSGFNDGNTSFALGSDWQFYTVTYKLNSTGTTTAIKKPVIRVFGGSDCYVSCAKLERGFNATDFNNGTGIKSIKIEATSERTKDLNNYTKTGFYYNNSNTDCAYISNLPVSNKAFFLTVENWGGSTTYLKQTCTIYSPVETYVRTKNSGTWGAWKKLISVDDSSTNLPKIDHYYTGTVGTSTKYSREDHQHPKTFVRAYGGVATATYVNVLRIQATDSWQDKPIQFSIQARARQRPTYVSVRLSNTNISSGNYSVSSFVSWGDKDQTLYLRQSDTNTFDLIIYKRKDDDYQVFDLFSGNPSVTITATNTNYGTTAPSSTTSNPVTIATYIGVPDTDLTWNGVATNNSVSPLTMAMDSEFGANRLAYFPSSRIKVEYSTNGGSTWTELTTGNYSEANKTKLVTTTSPNMQLGNGSTTDYSKNRLRITFDSGDMNADSVLYLVTRKIALYTGTANSTGFTCQIQTQTYAQYNTNNETFNNYGSPFALGGWSGWNTYPINFTLGGYKSANQTNSSSTRIKAIRLLFSQTGGTGNGFISRIRLYGETAYKTASQYANNNHIYTINENQDAIFPSKIIKEGGTSSQFLMANGDVQNKVTSISSSSTDTQYPSAKAVYDFLLGHSIEDTDLFDVLDCIDNNFDNLHLWDIVFNINNYYGHPNKNCSVANNVLRNNAVSSISLNKEFTSSTNYTLEFDYYTSQHVHNGFYFGVDPSHEDGTSMFASDSGLHVIVDVRNTFVEIYTGDSSSATTVYTHTSNLLTLGTHHIRIVRDGTNTTFYIDDVELYTYTNTQYNTIGLNKWGSEYNSISNIEIIVGD